MNKIQFAPMVAGDFASVLKQRVDSYFKDSNLAKKANFEMFLKSFLYLAAYFGVYYAVVFGGFSPLVSMALAGFLGLLTAGIGFNVGHDALHGAYSNKAWINTLMGHSFSIMGAGVFNWKIMHNVVHHSYTNIAEADGDLHPMPWLRFAKDLPRSKLHRFQHWYALGLYSMTSLVWVFVKDYVHIGKSKHLMYEKLPTPRKEYLELYVCKFFYLFSFLVLPILVMPVAWWQVLIGFLVMHLVAGFVLALTFQVGHLVENTEFVSMADASIVAETWTVHQLKTSSNFSVDRDWASWVFGGLNYQIEHHLFPKICHIHYRNLSPIVQKTAAEFDLPYNHFPSFRSAVKSHLRYLKMTGSYES